MRRALAAAVIAAAWIAPTVRAARGDPAVVDHYELGKREFEQKRYAQALEEFRSALAITPRPEVLYAMAQTQRMLGDCRSAIATYRAFLAGRPAARLAEYARANIERCEHDGELAQRTDTATQPAWYRDVAGDALVGLGLASGITGALVWSSGRSAATRLAEAPDYQTFVDRQQAAASALTKQRLGVASMIIGGAAILGGLAHYAHDGRRTRTSDAVLTIAPIEGGAMIAGHGRF